MWRLVLFGLVIAFALFWPSGTADACTCWRYRAFPIWPTPDAADVALDVTLVVAVSDTIGADHRLTDETGAEVPLTVVRSLEADEEGCALYDYVFLRPSTALAAGRRYTLTPSFPGVESSQMFSASGTFTTGSETRGFPPAPPVELSLVADHIGNQRFLQVFAFATAEDPIFLRAVGERTAVVRQLGPLASEGEPGIPLGDVPCANLELVDSTGGTFHSANLCEPSRCRTSTVYVDTTCGGNPGGDSWAHWQLVPEGCPLAPCATGGGGCTVVAWNNNDWLPCVLIALLFGGAYRQDRRGRGVSAPARARETR